MGSEWGTGKLGTDCIIKGRIGWKGYKKTDLRGNGPVVIGGVNVKNSVYLDLSRLKHLSQEKYDESPEIQLKSGDVLLVQRGNGIGDVALYNGEFEEATINPTMIVLSDFRGDSRFLFYYLVSNSGNSELLSRASGSSIPAIYQNSLKDLEYPMAPIAEQRAIAHILGTLDDKIELNRKMNETLEGMAQALFKSWFVDFDPVIDNALKAGNPIPEELAEKAQRRQAVLDRAADGNAPSLPDSITNLFPDAFQDSELGAIPEGWEVGCVKDIGEVICGKTPPTKNREYYGGDIPFITIPDMHGKVYIEKTGKSLSDEGACTQVKKYLPPNSVCVSCIATPGLVVLTSERSQTNQQINSIVPDTLSPFYVYNLLGMVGDKIKAAGSGGSVFANLNKSRFSTLEVMFAKEETVNGYHELVQPVFLRLQENEREITILSNLRDTLLPKLISGELRVPDAEKFVEDVV